MKDFYLLQSLVRGVGSNFIDHRLRQVDFRNNDQRASFPKIPDKQELDSNDLIILLGLFRARTDIPIANIALRHSIDGSSKAIVIDTHHREYNHLHVRK